MICHVSFPSEGHYGFELYVRVMDAAETKASSTATTTATTATATTTMMTSTTVMNAQPTDTKNK